MATKIREPKIRIIFDNTEPMDEEEIKSAIRESREDDNYEPTESEIYDWYNEDIRLCWESEEYELEKMFNNGDTYVLRGTCGLWYGTCNAGTIIEKYSDLSKSFGNYDYIKIYDEMQGGHGIFTYVGYHHDGTNRFQVRKLTDKGLRYLEKHEGDMSDRELHEKLWRKGYSVNIDFTNRVYGKI